MNPERLLSSTFLFKLLADQDILLPRYARYKLGSEYGVSATEFSETYPSEAEADAREAWASLLPEKRKRLAEIAVLWLQHEINYAAELLRIAREYAREG